MKRSKPFTASLASRKMLEALGWTVWNVEQTIPKTFIKRDCFKFGDLLAMSPQKGIMLVQATGGASTSNFHTRVAKIRATAEAGLWLASGGRIQAHSWEKSRPPAPCGDCDPCVGGRPDQCALGPVSTFKGRWCRVLEITAFDNKGWMP